MKKYVKLSVAVVIFAVFMVGVYALYQKLSAEYKPQQNLVTNSGESSQTESEEGAGIESRTGAESKPGETSGAGTDSGEASGTGTDSGEAAESGTDTDASDNRAIDFTMESAEGEEVKLYDFVGKPIVLNFWASWCGPCKAEIPDFQSAYEEYGEEIEFVMVNITDNVRETKESAMDFISEQGYTLPFYFDTDLEGSYAYSVYSLPMTYFINADGEVIAYAKGMIDAEVLQKGISMIQEPIIE